MVAAIAGENYFRPLNVVGRVSLSGVTKKPRI